MKQYLIFQGSPIHFLTALSGLDMKDAQLTIIANPNHEVEYMWTQIIQKQFVAHVFFWDDEHIFLKKQYDVILLGAVTYNPLREKILSLNTVATIVKIIHGISDYYEEGAFASQLDEVWTLFNFPVMYGRFNKLKDSCNIIKIPSEKFLRMMEQIRPALNLPEVHIYPRDNSVLLLHMNLGAVLMSPEDEFLLFYDAVKKITENGYAVYWKSHYQSGDKLFYRLKKEFSNMYLIEIPMGVPLEFFYKELNCFNMVVSFFSSAMWTLQDIFNMQVKTLMNIKFLQKVTSDKGRAWSNVTIVSFWGLLSFDPFDSTPIRDDILLSQCVDMVWYLLQDKELVFCRKSRFAKFRSLVILISKKFHFYKFLKSFVNLSKKK